MSNTVVSHVYRYVIDDVISQVRGEFEDMGIDDSILQELQRSWESNVARSRVANFGFKEDGYYDENGGGDNINTSSSNNGAVNNTNNNNTTNEQPTLQYPTDYHPPSAASLPNLAVTGSAGNRSLYGLPPLNMNNNRAIPDPSTLVNQYQMMPPKPPQQQNSNLPGLQLPGLPPTRPNLPQNDGANDDDHLTTEEIDQRIEDMIQSSSSSSEHEITFTASSFSGEPLALESLPESVKELMKEARDRAIKAGAISKHCRIAQLDGEAEDTATPAAINNNNTNNDDDINSDLDDTDDDDEEGEGGEEIEHIILCLYDKVTRTKNKWKCILKDGIMLVNGRDYLFHRANGDFEW